MSELSSSIVRMVAGGTYPVLDAEELDELLPPDELDEPPAPPVPPVPLLLLLDELAGLPPTLEPLLELDEARPEPLDDDVVLAPPMPGFVLPAAHVTPEATSQVAPAIVTSAENGRREELDRSMGSCPCDGMVKRGAGLVCGRGSSL